MEQELVKIETSTVDSQEAKVENQAEIRKTQHHIELACQLRNLTILRQLLTCNSIMYGK